MNGCCSIASKEKQLQQVAKEWCLVIRASQVVPVYPLSDDLKPGDIFLVSLPVSEQVKAYNRKGFLPLDNLIGRIQPNGYKEFYKDTLGVGGPSKPIPKVWINPDEEKHKWNKAPIAAFPSYSFSVKRGSGFNLALPISGVPVGLGLLNAEAAQGTILISDAHTYGVDTISLYRQLRDSWAIKNNDYLRFFVPREGVTNYIRVVTRVYMTGRLDISLQDTKSLAAGVTAQAPGPLDLLTATQGSDIEKATLENYKTGIEKINTLLKITNADDAGSGGELKLTGASGRTVSLKETFRNPIIIGYLGFDIAIGPDGVLGSPLPTYEVLSKGSLPQVVDFTETQTKLRALLRQLESLPNTNKSYELVMSKLGGDIKVLFLDRKDLNAKESFRKLIRLYTSGEPSGDGPHHQQVNQAIEAVLKDLK